MSSSSLVFLCSKEKAEIDEPLSNSPKKQQGELLIIDWNPEVGENWIFGRGIYLYVFYCSCYVKDMSTDLSEEKVLEDRDMDLSKEEDIIMDGTRNEHWRGVAEDGDDKKNIHDLRWEVYFKYNEYLIKRDF